MRELCHRAELPDIKECRPSDERYDAMHVQLTTRGLVHQRL
jgi:hypothetical protein